MRQLISIRYFLLPYILLLILAVGLLLATEHGDVVLWLNARRNAFLDIFFTYWTYVGDGVVFGVIFIGLLVRRWRVAVSFALSGLVVLLVSSILKRLVFPTVPRPKVFFESQEILRFIEGVHVYGSYSFPSGHTMTAFTVTTFLAMMMRPQDEKWSLMLLFSAVLVAISRIYLLQHFLIDVTVGSCIGVSIAMLMVYLLRGFMNQDNLKR